MMRQSVFLPVSRVTVDDPFWSRYQELVRTQVLPYQYEALHDRVAGAEKSYCMENFRKAGVAAAALKRGETLPVFPVNKWCYDENNCAPEAFHGWVFQDSDAYKWLEAAAYVLAAQPDAVLEQKADGVIDLISAAQLDSGYLDTLYIINDRDKIFTNLRDFHELYCFGHLAEAAAAYYRATGKDKLLRCARRFADLICRIFGDGAGQKRGYGGHEIAELALVKLYELTGTRRYLDTAAFFLRERGTKPYYFDVEHGRETQEDHYFYNQAHMPPVRQREAVGHAVRGVYLYTGMAAAAAHTEDTALADACEAVWNDIENTKLYITGGIGSTVHGEAFTFAYDLPNDLAYCETCASVGLMFFAKRMAEIHAEARFGDVAERALYNTVLAGMAADGKSFFYVNPLEVLPEASEKDERKRHVKPVRQKWFSCACCPPNLARLLASLGGYICSENEDTLFIHQYIGASVQTEKGAVTLKTTYAKDGAAEISVSPVKPFTLALRLPAWCRRYTVNVPGREENGWLYMDITGETVIRLQFDMQPQRIRCSNRVRANVGKAAVTCGPFVYCAEEADNGGNLQMLILDKTAPLKRDGDGIEAQGWRERPDERLYSEYTEAARTPTPIRLIPYYRWGNRGEGEMQVYLRTE